MRCVHCDRKALYRCDDCNRNVCDMCIIDGQCKDCYVEKKSSDYDTAEVKRYES